MSFLILMVCCLMGVIANPVDQSGLQELQEGTHEFTANLYKKIAEQNTGNFIVSPLSIDVVMALTGTGAKGETANQIRTGLSLPKSVEKTNSAFKELLPKLKGNEHYSLNSANNIYVKDGFKILDSFKQTAVDVYDAGVENIDFSKKEQAASNINGWVERKTNNRIKDLISPGDLSELTRLVLVNALYFKGKWTNKFDESDTTKRPFFTSETNSVDVDTMHTTASFNYYESPELDAKFLEMPYIGGDISMTIVLPNKKSGLPALETHLKDVFTTPQFKRERVHVQLPKFKIESTHLLKPIMEKMGITDPFGDNADFSGITGSKGLQISKVIQKAFIEVTEEGTEAAAATAVHIGLGSAAPSRTPPKNFKVDHPFVYTIKYKDFVLFSGRMTVPKA